MRIVGLLQRTIIFIGGSIWIVSRPKSHFMQKHRELYGRLSLGLNINLGLKVLIEFDAVTLI